MKTFTYRGFDIPVDLMQWVAGGQESFAFRAELHKSDLQRHVGIKAGDHIVEVGCGIGRDAMFLTEMLGPSGRYVGVDIIGPLIGWCSSTITSRHANFQFVHYDVSDQLHNPSGVLPVSACRLPVNDNSVDLVILQSVFTHLLEEDIGFYLREFSRVLKTTGLVYGTCFVVDEDLLSKIRTLPGYGSLTFEHQYSEGCYVQDTMMPTGAVAFTVSKLLEVVTRSKLVLDRPIVRGNWSGTFPEDELGRQDLMILRRA
jgi:SAM-dependent methyltransferase